MMKWDRRMLEMAYQISTWSKDPSTKVGAVITDKDYRVISVGYNGLPKAVEDKEERLNNRELKYKIIVHAERNAMLFAKCPLDYCTLFTVPFMPCATCASMVIQAGIKRVVAPYNENPRWVEDFKLTEELFTEAGVQLFLYNDQYEIAKVNDLTGGH